MDRLPFKRRRPGFVPVQIREVDPAPDWDEFGGVFTQENVRQDNQKRARQNSEFSFFVFFNKIWFYCVLCVFLMCFANFLCRFFYILASVESFEFGDADSDFIVPDSQVSLRSSQGTNFLMGAMALPAKVPLSGLFLNF